MNYGKIIHDVVEQYRNSPVDILGIGDKGEYHYLSNMKPAYARTIGDIDCLWQSKRDGRQILEIGSFLGAVSIALKQLGYTVHASDIPEFQRSASLQALYAKHGIPFAGVNLRKYQLPYESRSLDAVILCEVMEHLNFNPLPMLKEINRVLKKDGYAYIAMPNQACYVNRVRLLLGKSIHHPVQYFFNQLDRRDNMVVGLHWREYTLAETVTLVSKMGFEITRADYFWEPGEHKIRSLRALLERVAHCVPSLRPQQVVVARKIEEPAYDFWLTDANS